MAQLVAQLPSLAQGRLGLTTIALRGLLGSVTDADPADKGRLLVVDDDDSMRDLLAAGLGAHGFAVTLAKNAEEALAVLESGDFDVVLTDLSMPGMNGLEFCERVVANRPDLPVVVMTAFASLDTAVSAIRVGADDYVSKPIHIKSLCVRLERAARNRSLRDEVKRLREIVGQASRFDHLLGSSPAMERVHDLLGRIVDSEASVLITGESGTGKEVAARALHSQGPRADRPFVAVNCSAVPAQLLESELFGHARGAFTDAVNHRQGLFVKAQGGTLFLDEIGDMPPLVQPKLLRALQERRIRPVGADDEISVDVRVISSTNRDLETAVAEERFREDLYFRINVLRVELPPLRARAHDVVLLAQHFLDTLVARTQKSITGIAPPCAEKLLAYSWPGNVRELQNTIEHAVALARFEQISVADLPERIRDYKRSHVIVSSDDPNELVPMEVVESRYIARVLEATEGNKTAAARILGFDRKTLYRKLDRYKL